VNAPNKKREVGLVGSKGGHPLNVDKDAWTKRTVRWVRDRRESNIGGGSWGGLGVTKIISDPKQIRPEDMGEGVEIELA